MKVELSILTNRTVSISPKSFNNANLDEISSKTKDNRISLAASLLLCLFFLCGFGLPTQFNRFVVIALTTLLVGRYNETCKFLTNQFSIIIGDASFSIYLIHWPLFTWHRYANKAMYLDGQEATLISKFQ
jgi:peptidoglycan/LPS O-acetylase OafA/YrhL